MTHDTVACDEFELAGLETRASNDDPSPIGALWGRIFSEPLFEQIERIDRMLVAVYCEYDGDHTHPYTFFLGRRVAPGAEVPEGLVRRRVPAGRFARFVAEGEQPQALIETWQGIWGMPIERRYDADYELHPDDGGGVEVFVGV